MKPTEENGIHRMTGAAWTEDSRLGFWQTERECVFVHNKKQDMNINKKLSDNHITMYSTPDGGVNIEVMYSGENIWLSQKKMAELFGCGADNVSLHLKNIYNEKELNINSTAEYFSVVQNEGGRDVSREIKYYSLEAVISVGYRINSERATQFRQWSIGIIRNYIQKGFAVDKDRFIYGSKFSVRYFDDLLEEIREIRASERMSYQKITDIYASSIDYSSNVAETKRFFAMVQNKLHFAITGKTGQKLLLKGLTVLCLIWG